MLDLAKTDIEVKQFFATWFYLYTLIQNFTYLQWAQKV